MTDKRRQVLPNTEQVLCGEREAFESPLPSAVGTCLSISAAPSPFDHHG